jgi:hypothetical protein
MSIRNDHKRRHKRDHKAYGEDPLVEWYEALRGLMNYVGGWDHTDPEHPCTIARELLAEYEGRR